MTTPPPQIAWTTGHTLCIKPYFVFSAYWKMDMSNISMTENYEASLKVIELPDKTNLFLWNRFQQPEEKLTVINIFEGTKSS